MPSKRRLAAIMFTDIVGYTKLMQESEAAAVKLRTRHREVFEAVTAKYEGEIIQYYGDGTLSVFDSTVNAVRCGKELQEELFKDPRVPLRVGVHTGDILHSPSDIVGDAVNVASRIESMGVPGSVLFSGKVAGEIANQDDLTVKRLGSFHFKNVKAEMDVFALDTPGMVVPDPAAVKGKFASGKKGRRLVTPARLAALPLIALVAVGGTWGINRYNKVQWAKYEAMPTLRELVSASWRDYTDAYDLAMETRKVLKNDRELADLIYESSMYLDVTTEPEGAEAYYKNYDDPDHDWIHLGTTPISGVQVPKGFLRWKFEKEGFETVEAMDVSYVLSLAADNQITKESLLAPHNMHRTLDSSGSMPKGMTRVPGGQIPSGEIQDFFLDKYEVTNAEYKDFIDAGGYERPELWDTSALREAEDLSWAEAMARFVDRTSRPGPATWEASDYPDGEADHPVSGVSWYEADAYARFANKVLPTSTHWGIARGEGSMITQWPQFGGFAVFAPFSNYGNSGTVPVGSLNGVTRFGAYDMAGNVAEWCVNRTSVGHVLRGGGWNNNTYSYGHESHSPSTERSSTNGFRCALYKRIDSLPDEVFAEVRPQTVTIDYSLEPASDEIFEIYKEQFDYDKHALEALVDEIDTTHEDWNVEKVFYNAAYQDKRMLGYLFLPNSAVPPYQTVVYVPGSAAFINPSSDNISDYYEVSVFLDFIIKSGRAVFFPVYIGSFERMAEMRGGSFRNAPSHEFADHIVNLVKDFRTSIDYLETREDVDQNEIAYCGMSFGAWLGPIISAVEERVKTGIYIAGGLPPKTRPEIQTTHYLPRIKSPTLMVSGRYDAIFVPEESIVPMFDRIGTRESDKRLFLSESDHIPLRADMVREVVGWLDKYFGPVNRLRT